MKIRCTTVVFLAIVSLSIATELAELPANHKPVAVSQDFNPTVDNTLLKMEARIDVEDGMDLMQYENKENLLKPLTVSLTKSAGIQSKNGVSYVTAISEPRITPSSTSSQISGEIFKGEKSAGSIVSGGLRTMKVSGKDSYLDALEHLHSIKDYKQDKIQAGKYSDLNRPKGQKITRREYHEGPVYRPESDRYGAPTKSPAPVYGVPNYEGPSTQPPFFPTPSNSYSLPEHSFDNFGPSATYGSPQSSQGNPQPSYENPQPSYGSPAPSYGAPQPSYGSPQSSYGPPQVAQSSYMAPSPSYGAPSPQNVYGPPSGSYLPPQGHQQGYNPSAPAYGAPYALPGMPSLPSLPMIDFTWPFALKLNAFTIAKIILKLVIFKLIVKFIAIICLLLFIPKLEIVKKEDKQEDDEEGRLLKSSNEAMDRLNFLTSMVMGSIEKYQKNGGLKQNDCNSFGCRLRKALISGESWSDYIRLFKSYAAEEVQKVKETERAEHRTKNS